MEKMKFSENIRRKETINIDTDKGEMPLTKQRVIPIVATIITTNFKHIRRY